MNNPLFHALSPPISRATRTFGSWRSSTLHVVAAPGRAASCCHHASKNAGSVGMKIGYLLGLYSPSEQSQNECQVQAKAVFVPDGCTVPTIIVT
eukprot:4616144-Amphidinium_carterae.1